MTRYLIVSADDFGLSLEVNEGVERAHRDGILQAASLMVAGPAAADAVRRARALPSLKVGLHVVTVNGRPILPAASVPALVDRDGNLPTNLVEAGVRYFFNPGARRQLEAEIRAQFEAFGATGLALDHVNAQNHMHVHPTVASIILKIGRRYGLRAMRVPFEPPPSAGSAFLRPWLWLMRARLRRANLIANDCVFGIADSGHMTGSRVLELLAHVPEGVSEMYFHPATGPWPTIAPAIADYDFAGELAALTSPTVRAALAALEIRTTTFGELAAIDAR